MFSKYTHSSTDPCTHNDREDDGKVEAACSVEAVFLTSATAWPPRGAPPPHQLSPCAAQCHPEHQQQLE